MKSLSFLLMLLVSTNIFAQEELLKEMGLKAKPQEQEVKSTPAQKNVYAINCASPKSAVRTWLYGSNAETIKCFKQGSFDEEQLLQKAEELSHVFRSRGIIVALKSIPDDPDYKDVKKHSRYVLSRQLPDIYVQKSQGGWMFPTEVIARVDDLYKASTRLDLGPLYRKAPEWATEDVLGIDGLSIAQIVALFLLVIFGLFVRLLVTFLVSRQVGKIFLRFSFHHFEEILRKASMPIGNLTMALVVAMFVPGLELNITITHYIMIAVRIGAALSGVMLAYRSVDVVSHFLMQRALTTESMLDDQLVPLFRRGLKITVSVVGGIFILQNLNVDVTSLLAGVTIGGLAFSFAAKDTVANLFGSITIFADKPFSVGDWIKSASVEGIVESVGFRSTRVRTFYNSLVSVPNSQFASSVVDNLGARTYRRCLAELGIAYDTTPDKVEAFCNGIRAIIKAHPFTRKDYYEIHFSGYGDFSLKIMLYFFMKVPGWTEELRVRHEVYLDILRLAKKMDIRFAFPTQTLHIESMATQHEPKQPIPLTSDDLQNAAKYFGPQGDGVIPTGPRVGQPFYAGK